jgi:hypothetical protein
MVLDAKRLVEAAVDDKILLPGSPRVEHDEPMSPGFNSIQFMERVDVETAMAEDWERVPPDKIENLLGTYEPNAKLGDDEPPVDLITLFWKRIQSCAEWIQVDADALLEVVRIHEWAHALLHRGYDRSWVTEWRVGNGLKDGCAGRDALLPVMFCWARHPRDRTVEEHLAQLITYRAIEEIRAWPMEQVQDLVDASVGPDQLDQAFRALMEKQSEAYNVSPLLSGKDDWTAEHLLKHVRPARLEHGLIWSEVETFATGKDPKTGLDSEGASRARRKIDVRDMLCAGDLRPAHLAFFLTAGECEKAVAREVLRHLSRQP